MSTTATYTVNNPTTNTEYIAPSSYWANCTNGTSITCTIQTFDGSGNLVTSSSSTAIIRNISAGSNAGSYTGYGYNTTNASATSNGSTYAAAGQVGSSVARLTMYLTYTGSPYDQAPNTPSNLSPTGTITTLTPTFSGSFSDPTSGDYLSQYEIVVNSSTSGGGTTLWDSGNVSASSTERNNAAFSRAYGGSALAWGTSYGWRARVANQNGLWSAWSGWQTLTTTQAPNAPSITDPGANAIVTSTTPPFTFTYSSPSSVAQASYTYSLAPASGGATFYTSTVTSSVASGTAVTGSVASGAGLTHGQSYILSISSTDANTAQGPSASVTFTVSATPVAAPTSPVGGATENSQTPTLAWSYTSSAGYQEASYQVQVINSSTSATIWDSGQTTGSVTSVALPGANSIAWNTHCQWRVQVWDSTGIASGWSAYAAFYVVNSPTVNVTSPANSSTIATNTPTITWTYTANSGGYAQASVSITLADQYGNTLATYTQNGTGTSYTLPAGLLLNTYSYQLTVQATDTNSDVGTSGVITFTVSYPAPADMAGQPYPNAVNYAVSPYLNTDSNSDGVADNWQTSTSSGLTATYAIDPNVTQGVQKADGSGYVTGAQEVTITGTTGSAGVAQIQQLPTVASAGWTPGTTVLSVEAMVRVQATAGTPFAEIGINFYDVNNNALAGGAKSGKLYDTAGSFTQLQGPQNLLVPANTAYAKLYVHLQQTATGDAGNLWVYGVQLEAATANDAHFIAGDLGVGYSYDANGYSHRTYIAGNAPGILANPGSDGDSISAQGGSITFTWDSSLADSRFTGYLVERRRVDQQTDSSAWVTLATLTSKSVNSYTDQTAGSNVPYQYSVRQVISYSDGTTGVSQNRVIATGAVNFSPAYYLVSPTTGPFYNLRMSAVATVRDLVYEEYATYSQFLGRTGMARDAGPYPGYQFPLKAYFNPTFGDALVGLRRNLVQMQEANIVWYLKDPEGLVVPVHLKPPKLHYEELGGDTMLVATFSFVQAGDTYDY